MDRKHTRARSCRDLNAGPKSKPFRDVTPPYSSCLVGLDGHSEKLFSFNISVGSKKFQPNGLFCHRNWNSIRYAAVRQKVSLSAWLMKTFVILLKARFMWPIMSVIWTEIFGVSRQFRADCWYWSTKQQTQKTEGNEAILLVEAESCNGKEASNKLSNGDRQETLQLVQNLPPQSAKIPRFCQQDRSTVVCFTYSFVYQL